jgi:hypothetical protein
VDRGVLRKANEAPIRSASDEEVVIFGKDHAGGPVAGQVVKIHWKSGFSSDWNRQAIFVLASAFLAEHPDSNITLDDLQALFCRKLERTRQEWNRSRTMPTEEVGRLRVEAAKKNRRKGRLLGVRLLLRTFR